MKLNDLLQYASKRTNISYIDFLDTVPNKLKTIPSLKQVWESNKSKSYNQMLRSGGVINNTNIKDKRDLIFKNGGTLSSLKTNMSNDKSFDAFTKSSNKYNTKTIYNYIQYKKIIGEDLTK